MKFRAFRLAAATCIGFYGVFLPGVAEAGDSGLSVARRAEWALPVDAGALAAVEQDLD